MATSREPLGYGYSVRDLLIALVVIFMALSLLALVAARSSDPSSPEQGSLIVTLEWPKAPLADVDLWVKAPDDEAVGYRQRQSHHCDLVRDDLGSSAGSDSESREEVLCRGLPDGEWVVNAVLYDAHGAQLPVATHVEVMAVRAGSGSQVLLSAGPVLDHAGQEVTVWRFGMHAGQLEYGSVDDLPMNLFFGAVP